MAPRGRHACGPPHQTQLNRHQIKCGLLARRLAKVIVHLGLAAEATVTLGWFSGNRAARVLRVDVPPGCALNSFAGGSGGGNGVDLDRVAGLIDLNLLRSGRDFAKADLLTLARWGHFSNPELPWERIERLELGS